jgi:hypothetical protein
MYLVLFTRRDIAKALDCLAKFILGSSQKDHQIPQFNEEFSINHGADIEKGLKCYNGTSWGDDLNTRGSTTGYITNLDKNLIIRNLIIRNLEDNLPLLIPTLKQGK